MTQKFEDIIRSVQLAKYSQQSPNELVKSIKFIYAEKNKVQKQLQRFFERTPTDLSEKQLNKFIFIIRKKSILNQAIILQVTNWMKASYRPSMVVLRSLRAQIPHKFEERFFKMGPKIKKEYWSNSLLMASNFIRHKDEWHFETFQRGPGQNIVPRKRIIDTLNDSGARRSAQHLLKVGLKEDDLFARDGQVTDEFLEALQCSDCEELTLKCTEWLDALNSFIADEVADVIRNAPIRKEF